MENRINIIPVNSICQNILTYLQANLDKIFKTVVFIQDKINLPQNSFDRSRNQYNANKILHYLSENITLKNIRDINLAILDVDIFVPSLNFVFGLASSFPKICLISIARLNPLFYSCPDQDLLKNNSRNVLKELTHKERKIFELRILKESVHEIGHTLGLRHCQNPRCVMFFSNSLVDTDKKDYHFCSKCSNQTESNFLYRV